MNIEETKLKCGCIVSPLPKRVWSEHEQKMVRPPPSPDNCGHIRKCDSCKKK